ncbi:MAG: hypothetical protein R2699_05840 [Acidimicrobiales bacterium]
MHPQLARDAAELFVFQRTPSSIDVRNNHEIDPEWFATLDRAGSASGCSTSPRCRRWLRRRGPGQDLAGPTSPSASATG